MVYRFLVLLVVALLCSFSDAIAQGTAPEHVKWEIISSPESVTPGNSLTVEFSAKIAQGWKLYAMDSPRPSWHARLNFDALPAGIEQAGTPTQSDPVRTFDKYFESDVSYFKTEAVLKARFSVDETAAKGLQVISGKIGYQICHDEMGICLPPYFEVFTAQFDVIDSSESGQSSSGSGESKADLAHLFEGTDQFITPPSVIEEPIDEEPALAEPSAEEEAELVSTPVQRESRGFWGFILLAIGAGIGALLMPCVFPMIPLTVSYFTKHAHNRGEAVRMAGVYGLAIVTIFTGLGVLTALLIGASGAQVIAANPWINLFIGLVFIVFALSLLGLFELRLPNGLINFFNRQSNEQAGYAGVLFMGTTLTLVSFSCTAPFVGTLLAATAGGEWIYPVIGMLVFSATFALPFVGFALFPNGLSRLPASGNWMNTLKVVFGFIELAAAIKFLSNADLVWGWNIISRPMAISATVVILFLTGLYLIGKLRLEHDESVEKIGTLRLMFAIGFFGLSLYMLPGLFGAPLNHLDAYLPPRQGSDVSLVSAFASPDRSSVISDEAWFEDIDLAYAEAQAIGKPVFIDFTGYTCTNCRQMESTVFPQVSIVDRFSEQYVLLRLYTDDLDEGPALQKFQLKLTGTVALPTYAIVDPGSGNLISKRSGILSVEDFGDFLDDGAEVFSDQYLASSEEPR